MMETLEMPRSISKEKRDKVMGILGNTAFAENKISFDDVLKRYGLTREMLVEYEEKPNAYSYNKPLCNHLMSGTHTRAKIRFIDDKIACCSQVCDDTCLHYTDCQEYELIIREAGPKAEWEEIGLGMYALKKEPNEE